MSELLNTNQLPGLRRNRVAPERLIGVWPAYARRDCDLPRRSNVPRRRVLHHFQSLRGKALYHSIAALRRRVGPHIAEAVEQLMAGCAGGAEPIRIQINLYGDDDDD
ncbi:hypothetical protein RI054_12g60360 [Pseudoscourfieldia marina]